MEQTKKHTPAWVEVELRKKILKLHNPDLDSSGFDTESLLSIIDGILSHLKNPQVPLNRFPPTNHDKLHTLLFEINCVLNCKCSGRDTDAPAFEIMKLLADYAWEAKIVIVVASLVLEFAQFRLIAMLQNDQTNPLANIVSTLNQIPDTTSSIEIKSKDNSFS